MSARLMVIERCGQCKHLEPQEGDECACSLTVQRGAKLPPKGVEATQEQMDSFYGKLVDRDGTPPDWCPLPKAGWQPIETAPGGREALLLWCPERQNIQKCWWRNGEWTHRNGDPLMEEPTHWQPLPDPPQEAEEMGSEAAK